MSLNLTGDIKDYTAKAKEGVTLHNMPKVLISELSDADAVINDFRVSGKRIGAMVVGTDDLNDDDATTAALYIACGSETTSSWALAATLIGSPSAVTPA